jgi:hypothetical protein
MVKGVNNTLILPTDTSRGPIQKYPHLPEVIPMQQP